MNDLLISWVFKEQILMWHSTYGEINESEDEETSEHARSTREEEVEAVIEYKIDRRSYV